MRIAIGQVRDGDLAWAKWSEETLRKGYYKARQHHGDSPPPVAVSPEDRWTFLLQRWDPSLSPEHARKLVADAVAVAGWRLQHFTALFDVMERRTSWNGDPRRKASQIRAWFCRMAADPRYFPPLKEPAPDRDADAVRALIGDGPKCKAEIARSLGKTKAAASAIIARMLKSGEIVRVSLGVFAAPGTIPYVMTRDAILDVLTEAAGEVTSAAIRAATGKPKTSISAAIDHLISDGLVVRVRRGVYALATVGAVCHGWARDEIMAALKPGKWMRQAALIAATGRRPSAIASALQRLLSEGRIRRVAHGFYVLAGRRRGRRSRTAPQSRNSSNSRLVAKLMEF